jgi:hypothetical protein
MQRARLRRMRAPASPSFFATKTNDDDSHLSQAQSLRGRSPELRPQRAKTPSGARDGACVELATKGECRTVSEHGYDPVPALRSSSTRTSTVDAPFSPVFHFFHFT